MVRKLGPFEWLLRVKLQGDCLRTRGSKYFLIRVTLLAAVGDLLPGEIDRLKAALFSKQLVTPQKMMAETVTQKENTVDGAIFEGNFCLFQDIRHLMGSKFEALSCGTCN